MKSFGNYRADEGEIYLDENRTSYAHAAKTLGISIIHQELMLAENVTVAQNIFMGRELLKNRLLRTLHVKRMNEEADEVLNGTLRAGIDVKKKVELLSVAQKQLIEIAKAIMTKARIIVMDEPTSSLTSKDIDALFQVIRDLKRQGTAVVYISHRMEEISKIGDRVTVLRDGEYVDTVDIDKTDIKTLIRMMVGRNLDDKYPKEKIIPGEIALKVKNLTQNGVLHDISFEARRGEILGIFGLIGSGRTELAKAIFGADPIDAGEIEVFGKPLRCHSPKDAIGAGIGLIPEDRKLEGLIGIMSVSYNTTLPIIGKLKREVL
jgi:ribose transport system ATP-binding protein